MYSCCYFTFATNLLRVNVTRFKIAPKAKQLGRTRFLRSALEADVIAATPCTVLPSVQTARCLCLLPLPLPMPRYLPPYLYLKYYELLHTLASGTDITAS